MSSKLLGETFDIHGGGLDLVFRIMKMKSRKVNVPTARRRPSIGCTTA